MSNNNDCYLFEYGIHRAESVCGHFQLLCSKAAALQRGFETAPLDKNGQSLIDRIGTLGQPYGPFATKDFESICSVRHVLLASSYHMSKIASEYTKIVDIFANLDGPIIEGNTWSAVIGFEFDSFLMSAVRVAEYLRLVIWEHYPEQGKSEWRSFEAMCKSSSIPLDVREKLAIEFQPLVKEFKAYRNCVAHYNSLLENNGTIRAYNINGEWGLRSQLPSIPTPKPEPQGRTMVPNF